MRQADVERDLIAQQGVDTMIAGLAGVPGISSWPPAAAPANGISLAAALRESFDQQEKIVRTNVAAGLSFSPTTTTIFTVAGGPFRILELFSVCASANNANLSTLQWQFDGTLGSATTITGASASLASLVAGDMLVADFTALATAPRIIATGTSAGLASVKTSGILCNGPGVIQAVVGTALISGLWVHYMRYVPYTRGFSVVPAF